MVTPEKFRELELRMKVLGIFEDDLEEKFIRGSGKGGQKRNKTSSSVMLLHKPTGIVTRCEAGRSQALNRFTARRELCDKIDSQINNVKLEKDKQVSKVRRQKARRSRKAKNKILQDKSFVSKKKVSRKNVVD